MTSYILVSCFLLNVLTLQGKIEPTISKLFKVTPGKNSCVRHFKGKHDKPHRWKGQQMQTSEKKMNCQPSTPQKKIKTTVKMTMCHSTELIGYQAQAHWQNNCTVLIKKYQSSKVCEHFSIF